MKELCLAQSGLEIRAGSSGDEHRKIPHLAEKEMVGTRRLELLTSTVANFQVAVLPTTYRSLVTAEQRGNTGKPNFLQVILQARFCTGITRPDTEAVLVIRFTAQLSCRELGLGSPPSRSGNR